MSFCGWNTKQARGAGLGAALILPGLALFLLVSCATSGPLEFVEPPERGAEGFLAPYDELDYEIYNTVINTLYLSSRTKRIVITRETETLTPVTESSYEAVQRAIPGLDRGLYDSLYWMMQSSHNLSTRYFRGLHAFVDLVSRDSVSGLFATGTWDMFYNEFPSSQGLMSFSRVAYSHDLERALVYVGNQRGGRDGRGYIIYLIRRGPAWHVAGRASIWVS